MMPMCWLCIPLYLTLIRVVTFTRTIWTGPRIQRTRIDPILKVGATDSCAHRLSPVTPVNFPGSRLSAAACLSRMRLTVFQATATRPVMSLWRMPSRASAKISCLVLGVERDIALKIYGNQKFQWNVPNHPPPSYCRITTGASHC